MRLVRTNIILKERLFTVSILVVCALVSLPAKGALYVIFRYDDFSADRSGERENDLGKQRIWEAEQIVDGLFQKFDFPYVIAIIPQKNGVSLSDDPEKVEFIKHAVQAEKVEVAQHGFAHINHTKENHKVGEFRERDYETQLQDIKIGKEILCKSCELSGITTFVPPWNTWDNNTAKALKKTGFSILSADCYYYHEAAKDLTLIPFTAQLWDLELMLNDRSLPKDGIVVVLYHPSQIVVIEGKEGVYFGIERLEELLRKLSILPEVNVVTLTQLADEVGDLTTERCRKANALWRQRSFWGKLLPVHMRPGTSRQAVYLTEGEYSRILGHWKIATAGLIAGLSILGLLTRYLFSHVLADRWRSRIDILATLLFCFSIIAELRLMQRGYHISGIRAVPVFFSVSFVIAFISKILGRKSLAEKVKPSS